MKCKRYKYITVLGKLVRDQKSVKVYNANITSMLKLEFCNITTSQSQLVKILKNNG